MIRLALVTVLACGCLETATPTCDPSVTLDATANTDDPVLDIPHDGTSVCMRIDTTSIARPHIEVSGPSSTVGGPSAGFALDLRDTANVEIAAGTDVVLGTETLQVIDWDPAGGAVYDVLVNIKMRNPDVVDAGAIVDVQLSSR